MCKRAENEEGDLLITELRGAGCGVAGRVVLDAMTQDQVLSARRGADRVGLHEAQPVEGAFQRGGSEEAAGDGKPPQIVEGYRHHVAQRSSRHSAHGTRLAYNHSLGQAGTL